MSRYRNRNLSYWEQKYFLDDIDYLVLGAGITGLQAAIEIKTKVPDRSVLVIERGILPAGASIRNAGFACIGSPTELLDDLKTMNTEEVIDLVKMRYRGLLDLRKQLGDAEIGYRDIGNYEVFTDSDIDSLEEVISRLDLLNALVAEATGEDQAYQFKNPDFGSYFPKISKVVLNRLEGMLNTGKLMKALMDRANKLGIHIWTGCNVKGLDEFQPGVELENGWELYPKKLIIATNAFARELLPQLSVLPGKNQVLVAKFKDPLPFEGAFHYDRGYFYFRTLDDHHLLLGGGRHLYPKASATWDFGVLPEIQDTLKLFLGQHIIGTTMNTFEIISEWSGILGLGQKKSAVLEKLSPHTVVAVRLGGMGIAIGTTIGKEAARLMLASAHH